MEEVKKSPLKFSLTVDAETEYPEYVTLKLAESGNFHLSVSSQGRFNMNVATVWISPKGLKALRKGIDRLLAVRKAAGKQKGEE